VPDLKALSGDTSDNIKGVPGIGEKTAQRLLADFETVEGLYARIDDVPARWRTTLAEHEGQVRSNKRLATIDCHVPIELDLEAARLEGYDRAKVLTLFQELEFRTLVDKMPQVGEPDRSAGAGENGKARAGAEAPGEEGLVSSEAGLRAVATGLLAAGDFVLHPVAIARSVVDHDLLGFALALEDGPAWYAPAGASLSEETILDVLRPVLESADAGKVAHDAKLLHTLLAERGITLRGVAFDTMIAGYLSNPANRASTVKDLAFKELGQDIAGVAALARKGSTLRDVPPEEVGREAIAEARLIQRLAGSLRDDLQQRSQLELFETVELPLTPVLSRMERAGIKVDERILGEMARELAAQIREAELAVYNAVGHQFTINSTQQLARVLVEELHLPLTKRTKTGYSTDATVLEELVGVHPVIEHILRYRQLTKLKSTYVDALPALINPRTGRVHTTFNQAVAATGRLSSENPNLQNIPVRTELGRAIRRAFVAEGPDAVLFAADYAQIELRIAAHITRDPLLVEAFQRDEDVHAATAATVFGVPLERVTDEQRRLAKTTNFAVLYGISDFGLSQRVGIARSDAAPFIKSYLEKYRGINAYIHSTLMGARERGYVETPLGRRRYIPELRSNNPAVRGAGERMAINMPIQGAQADLIKLAMIRIERALEGSGLGARMLLQVHDELVFETPREEVPRLARLAQEAMEGALELIVPIKVEMKVGTNWYDLAPLVLEGSVP
jgi:DNA polymerase-1